MSFVCPIHGPYLVAEGTAATCPQCAIAVTPQPLTSKDHVEFLIAAIRRHRDQRGDDRCWQDDLELYAALPEGVGGADLRLPSPQEMLENCKRYCTHRHDPTQPYRSPEREVERLEAELKAAVEHYRRTKEQADANHAAQVKARENWKAEKEKLEKELERFVNLLREANRPRLVQVKCSELDYGKIELHVMHLDYSFDVVLADDRMLNLQVGKQDLEWSVVKA